MKFSYKPLWRQLFERDMTKEQLRTALKISPATIAKMGKGEKISMDVIGRICSYLNCKIEEVVEFVPDDE